ncbi:MAG: radical SAM protein [Alphaproteobacteria bacterium]|nr:radical SAM protein [Alphaproteobacteria bacterium]
MHDTTLTRWVRPIQDDVAPALRRLLSLGDQASLEWEDRTPHAPRLGTIAMSIGAGELEVRLALNEDSDQVRLRVEHPRSRTPQVRSVLDAYRSNAGAVLFSDIAKALRAWRAQAEVQDHVLRRLVDSPIGPIGMLRIGFGCSQNCSFCWQDRQWPSPEDDAYMQWVDELAAGGARLLTISGGEPTLRPILPELIARATQHHGIPVNLQTNAIRLKSPRYVERLREAGLRSLLVSFHSADPSTSDHMTRAPKTWANTVRGIEEALRQGLWVVLNCVVEDANVRGLAAHAAFIVERFVRPFPDNPVRVVNYSQPGPYYDRTAYLEQMANLVVATDPLNQAVATLANAGVELAVTGTCGFPPCVFREQPEKVVWVKREQLDAQDLSGRSFGTPCGTCAAQNHCVGIRREYLDRFGDAGLRPYETMPDVPRGLTPTWQVGTGVFMPHDSA